MRPSEIGKFIGFICEVVRKKSAVSQFIFGRALWESLRVIRVIRQLFKGLLRRKSIPAEGPRQVLSLVIEGVEVYAVEACPTGLVRFCAPGHPWNPTDNNIIVCDLPTFVSLAASQDSQRLAAFMVKDGLRALRAKERAMDRRLKRKQKRAQRANVAG